MNLLFLILSSCVWEELPCWLSGERRCSRSAWAWPFSSHGRISCQAPSLYRSRRSWGKIFRIICLIGCLILEAWWEDPYLAVKLGDSFEAVIVKGRLWRGDGEWLPFGDCRRHNAQHLNKIINNQPIPHNIILKSQQSIYSLWAWEQARGKIRLSYFKYDHIQ